MTDDQKRAQDVNRLESEWAADPLQTPVANFEIQEYERHADTVGLAHAVGEGSSALLDVPGFVLKVRRWSEQVPDDLLKLKHISESGFLPVPESVCKHDDRVLIGNTTAAPWKYICKVYIDRTWVGSGFFIGPRCIITNGHVVFPNGRWAREIIVAPGQNGAEAPFGMQASSRFVSVRGWTDHQSFEYDYAAIMLPDDLLYTRLQGFMGYRIAEASELLNNSGYPADKPAGTQWYNAGPITTMGTHRFYYMIDTSAGQSGSPCFVGPDANATAVGVHAYGGCPNSAVRIIEPVAANFSRWRQIQ